MSDPWAFGWTQVFTLFGFMITIGIAASGFKSFNSWRREKIEEKRIDVAIEALSLVYDSRRVFNHIRSQATAFDFEDMPVKPGEDVNDRFMRGIYFAVVKRIEGHRDFFKRLSALQPRFMAVFGPKSEKIFETAVEAVIKIQVAAEAMMGETAPLELNDEVRRKYRRQLRAECFGRSNTSPEEDSVGQMIDEFRNGFETLCRPVVEREYGKHS